MSLTPYVHGTQPTEPESDPWERLRGESPQAYEAFSHYLDMPPATRTCRAVAVALGKSRRLILGWSAKHDWVGRAADWDAEQARALRRNQLAQIEKSNRDDVELAEAGLVLLRQYMPTAAAQAGTQPRAWAEMAKTLTKIKRDALGVAEPDRRMVVAGDPNAPIHVDTEVRDVMPFLSDAQRMRLHDIAIDSVRIRCQMRAGRLPPNPSSVLE